MSIFYVAAHALVLNQEGKALVMKRALCNDYMPLTWDIPGGTVEAGETIEEALVRELREETGLCVEPECPIYVFSNLSQLPRRQTIQIVFLCKYINGEVILNPEEHEDFRWIGYHEIQNYECIGFLQGLIQEVDWSLIDKLRK